ncbi:hypothetical protein HPT25_02530 [Bacillus sp. BRMEA1]|uniref:hypothetical protein n=1 Tax=Neobacillus endophyticus TaxID=2738405 RepID=UPI001566C745|nr:hypothetical protein [Neobacillus endophyticus]NRD76363.1 hypothetical protein [Neobacillus endophyticus]
MVNENFYSFKRSQRKGTYLGSENRERARVNDEEYNNQSDTDKSPGATGRKI